MRFWILALLISLTDAAAADAPLTLKATYVVTAFGADIGESRQNLRCDHSGQCELTAHTRPTGIARLFTREHLQERSHFSLAPQWQGYEKKKFDDRRLVKTVTLMRQPDAILYKEGQRRFPVQENLFDALSLPFVLHRWQKAPDALYLQDNNWQDRLEILHWAEPDTLDGRAMRHYTLKGRHAKVEIWLDAAFPVLPVKVSVRNLERNKTITLTLKQESHTIHAPE